jgi:hypothetical protein
VAKEKICGACGGTFECAAPERGCWCEKVCIDRQAVAALREQSADCVCPKCLNKAAAETVQ